MAAGEFSTSKLADCRTRMQSEAVEGFNRRFSDGRCVRVEPYANTFWESSGLGRGMQRRVRVLG